jgi:hypothetical protein
MADPVATMLAKLRDVEQLEQDVMSREPGVHARAVARLDDEYDLTPEDVHGWLKAVRFALDTVTAPATIRTGSGYERHVLVPPGDGAIAVTMPDASVWIGATEILESAAGPIRPIWNPHGLVLATAVALRGIGELSLSERILTESRTPAG